MSEQDDSSVKKEEMGKQELPNDTDIVQKLVNGNDIEFLNDVHILLTIEIGRTQIKIRDLLNLSKDSIIDLNKNASDPVDIYANGKLISRGNIMSVNGKYCIRLTSVSKTLTEQKIKG